MSVDRKLRELQYSVRKKIAELREEVAQLPEDEDVIHDNMVDILKELESALRDSEAR